MSTEPHLELELQLWLKHTLEHGAQPCWTQELTLRRSDLPVSELPTQPPTAE